MSMLHQAGKKLADSLVIRAVHLRYMVVLELLHTHRTWHPRLAAQTPEDPVCPRRYPLLGGGVISVRSQVILESGRELYISLLEVLHHIAEVCLIYNKLKMHKGLETSCFAPLHAHLVHWKMPQSTWCMLRRKKT